MLEKKVATHKAVADSGGYRFLFYCDVSGAHVCTTKKTYCGDAQEEALMAAWEAEGREHFNPCHKCGKFVIDAMFNPDVLECVECAPFEAEAKFCKICGAKVASPGKTCPACGKKLIYEGSVTSDDAKDAV